MKEKIASGLNGFIMLAVFIALIVFIVVEFANLRFVGGVWTWIAILVACFIAMGFTILQPNEAAALVLFGKYHKTLKNGGFYWVLPFYTKNRVSLRIRNLQSDKMKVNDNRGNPIEISAVMVWRINETAQALFEVENVFHYVQNQTDSAIRQLASLYAYDLHDDDEPAVTLREGVEEVSARLGEQLEQRLSKAGVEVIEARITHLAYAQEIAQAMLRRQAAEAIVNARRKLVFGAVSMVEMALKMLDEKNLVELSNERKAQMVSNLLVVLCGETEAQPVINAGTLDG